MIKAGLVGWFFMHLKFEGNWVYILIVPAFILATILVLALMSRHGDAAGDRGKPRRRFVFCRAAAPCGRTPLRAGAGNPRSGPCRQAKRSAKRDAAHP